MSAIDGFFFLINYLYKESASANNVLKGFSMKSPNICATSFNKHSSFSEIKKCIKRSGGALCRKEMQI